MMRRCLEKGRDRGGGDVYTLSFFLGFSSFRISVIDFFGCIVIPRLHTYGMDWNGYGKAICLEWIWLELGSRPWERIGKPKKAEIGEVALTQSTIGRERRRINSLFRKPVVTGNDGIIVVSQCHMQEILNFDCCAFFLASTPSNRVDGHLIVGFSDDERRTG